MLLLSQESDRESFAVVAQDCTKSECVDEQVQSRRRSYRNHSSELTKSIAKVRSKEIGGFAEVVVACCKLAIKDEKIPTFSEVCKRVVPGKSGSKGNQEQITTDMTRCQNLQYASATMTDR